MAVPMAASRFVAVLRAEGVRVVEVDDWEHHNRNSRGPWGPVNGVMIHHTVSSGTGSTVALCRDGYADLPGPLCHGVIDKQGVVHLVGYGRANHAGGGDPAVLSAVAAEDYGDRPPAPHEHEGSAGSIDGNARFYGFECINLGDGKDPWPAAQLDAIERVSAAICRVHGWTARSVIGHLEWSDWKSDPRGWSMPSMRARVEERLRHPAGWTKEMVDMQLLDKVDLTWKDADGQSHLLWAGQLINNRSEITVSYALANAAASLFLGDQTKKLVQEVSAKVDGLSALELTDAQVQAIADALAGAPALAEAIAEKVAEKLAARLAE